MEIDTAAAGPWALTGADSEWFWAMVQAIGVITSFVFIAWQIRIQSNANILTAVTGFDEHWNSSRVIHCRAATCEARTARQHPGIGNAEESVCAFFENLGLYVSRQVFSKELAWELYSYYAEHYWFLLWPEIQSLRKRAEDPTLYSHFGSLIEQLRDYGRRRGVAPQDMDGPRLDSFLYFELQREIELRSQSNGRE